MLWEYQYTCTCNLLSCYNSSWSERYCKFWIIHTCFFFTFFCAGHTKRKYLIKWSHTRYNYADTKKKKINIFIDEMSSASHFWITKKGGREIPLFNNQIFTAHFDITFGWICLSHVKPWILIHIGFIWILTIL